LTVLGAYLWALETPGGYHVHAEPEASANPYDKVSAAKH